MRAFAILFSSLFIGSCVGCISILQLPDAGAVEEVPREVALELLEREVTAAKALGFEVQQRGEGTAPVTLQLDGGCAAFVLVASGPQVTPSVALTHVVDSLPDVARSTSALNVAHVQACAGTSELIAVMDVPEVRRGLYADHREAHWVALVGEPAVIGGNAKLNRGVVPNEEPKPSEPGPPQPEEAQPAPRDLDALLEQLATDAGR